MVPALKSLAAYHRVYAPDLPGFGESEKPRRVLNVTGLSDSLAAWMREIRLERAALIGNSFGYQIIADLAVRHPERVERTMLQGPIMDCGRGPF
jgi:2-hydroxy-6-oxonona-2,4-dienedioate hydrolase